MDPSLLLGFSADIGKVIINFAWAQIISISRFIQRRLHYLSQYVSGKIKQIYLPVTLEYI